VCFPARKKNTPDEKIDFPGTLSLFYDREDCGSNSVEGLNEQAAGGGSRDSERTQYVVFERADIIVQ
jgi:hypothetical protein